MRISEFGGVAVAAIDDGDSGNPSLLDNASQHPIEGLGRKHLVVDLSQVESVTSLGVAVTVAAQGIALIYQTGLAFAGVQPRARKTLDLVGVDKTLSLYHTVDNALAAVKKRARPDVAEASEERQRIATQPGEDGAGKGAVARKRMIMDAAVYSRYGNELRISGSLDSPLDIRFDIEMRALVDALKERGFAQVVVDVRDVPMMVSQYVGALVAAAAEVRRLGGTVTVRASGRVADVLRGCGIGKVVVLEVD